MTPPILANATSSRFILASAEADLLLTLKSALNSSSSQLDVVATAQEALTAMSAAEAACLVLLDANLPGMEFTQLLAAARAENVSHFPIILLSDTVSDEWVERLADGIIDDMIPTSSDATYWQVRIQTTLAKYRMSCELEKLRDDALHNTQLDQLTGVYNRESLLSMLFSETDRIQRTNGSLCLILLDIDDFGHWNALFGTEVCDDLLRQMVARIRCQLRSYDLLGRAGKDEFIVALPGCSGVNAMMLAERLRQEVFTAPYKIAGQSIRLSACFGMAMSRGRSPMVVLFEAEIALRQAKTSGPDLIQCFSEDGVAANDFQSPSTSSKQMVW